MTLGVIQQRDTINDLSEEDKQAKALHSYGNLQIIFLLFIPVLATINNLLNRVLRKLHENSVVSYLQIALFLFTGTSIILSEKLDFGYLETLNMKTKVLFFLLGCNNIMF